MLKSVKTTSRTKSLLRKMLMFIALPTAIIFCITAVIVLSNIKQSVTQLTTNHLTAESQSASHQINNYFSKYSEITNQMVANDLIQQYLLKPIADKSINTQNFKSVKQTVDNIYNTDPDNLSAVWIGDCASNTLISQNKDEPMSMVLSERPWYQPAVAKKSMVVIEPYTDALTGKTVMSMVAPIYKTETTDLIGFAGIDITIDQLDETMKNQKIGKTGFCILASADGQLIYHPDTALKGKSVSESNMSKNIVSAI